MIIKHSVRRLRLIIVGYVISLFFVGLSFHPEVSAQPRTGQGNGKTDVQKFRAVKTWYLYFKITVKGQESGSLPEKGGYESISWKIDDTYTGNVALDVRTPYTKPGVVNPNMTPQQKMAAAISQLDSLIQWTHMPVGVRLMGPFNGLMPLHINKDELIIVYGQDPCGDNTKTTTTTKGDNNDFSYQAPFLKTDTDKLFYNVVIPVKPDGEEKLLKRTQTIEEKVDGKMQKDTSDRDVPFKFFDSLPTIKGLLENGQIKHLEDLPLDAVSNSIEFDSGELEPDKPIISNLPDSKTKVKVRVYYKLSRTSITIGN